MNNEPAYGLELLLAFNGRVHHLERGYWIKFEIARVAPDEARPHGLVYSFTLHAPDGVRLVGFDNAHAVRSTSGRRRLHATSDHWHRSETDPGRPYRFRDAGRLLDDFFDEVARVLSERGIGPSVLGEDDGRRSK